jgi:hypothetical protein
MGASGVGQWAKHAAAASYTSATSQEQGADGAVGLVRSSKYLPPELMPSLAACKGADIAVLTRDTATGDIHQRPHVYLATPARGAGALIQMPQHWQQLADRIRQPSRASGSRDAPLRIILFEALYDAVSGQHKTLHRHPSWPWAAVPLQQTGTRLRRSAPLGQMTHRQ